MIRPLLMVAACLLSTPAYAGVSAGLIARGIDCARQIGIVSHAQIIVRPEWSRPGDGMCCTEDGQIANHRYQAFSTYSAINNVITLYAGAQEPNLVHELAANAWVRSGGNKYDKQTREIVGYDAERRAQGECG